MIDHEIAAKQNQERMRQVYQQLSTYRNIKTPEIQDQPAKPSQTTYVSSQSSNYTVQQKKEQQQQQELVSYNQLFVY